MKSIDNSLTLFLNEIALFLKKAQVVLDPNELAHYGQDWSNTLTVRAGALIFPESTEQVSLILAAASRFGIAVIPSGGRTGLSAGAVATQGEVLLSLEKLNFIGPLHENALTVRVGAGAITQAVHEYCSPFGVTWPVDFASKGSSSIGGNIATNAGGVRVIRYGNTRNWVLGLTAVTMDGTIHHFNGELEKNNTGFDLRQLLIGSEGTLAVVTEATLKLSPLPRSRLVFFFSLADFSSVIQLFGFARKRISNLSAFECMDRKCLDSVLHHFKKSAPLKELGTAFVLLEVESGDLQEELFEKASSWLEKIFESGFILDGVMAQNDREAAALWQLREGIAESILHDHDVHQEDVSVPIAKLDDFYSVIHKRYQSALPDYPIFFFGHIGDGNLHIFIQKPAGAEKAEFIEKTHAADLDLFKVLSEFQGSVSAEHGIGLLKKHALHFSRTEHEIQLLKGIKRVFDPQGLLNPGKIFD